MPKYTKEELAREDIVVKCNNKKQADYIVAWAGKGVDTPYQQDSLERIYFRYYNVFQPDFLEVNPNEYPEYTRIDFAEQFPEYQKENKMKVWKPITTYEELIKLHGVACRCKIQGEQINDAKISVKNNIIFICQNIKDGYDIRNKLGYKFSWWAMDNKRAYECTDIEIDEVKEPESIPTEYAVLTNATEAAKKQIAEFEQVLAQIKIDAMKLGSRDLARLIKALKGI